MRSKLSVVLAIVAATLALAAASPKATYHVLSRPSRWLQKAEMAGKTDAMRRHWVEVLRRAEMGDPEAKAEIAPFLLQRHALPGIQTDSATAIRWIGEAADAGVPGAILNRWRMEDGTPEGILRLVPRILATNPGPRDLARLRARLIGLGPAGCDPGVVEALRSVHAHLVAATGMQGSASREAHSWEWVPDPREFDSVSCGKDAPAPER